MEVIIGVLLGVLALIAFIASISAAKKERTADQMRTVFESEQVRTRNQAEKSGN